MRVQGRTADRASARPHAGQATPAARRVAPSQPQQARLPPVRAASGPDPEDDANLESLRERFFRSEPGASGTGPSSSGSNTSPAPVPREQPGAASGQDLRLLNVINPYELGRQTRQALNDVWEQLSRVSSPTRSFMIDDVLEVDSADAEFAAPQAANTTVLVVGATGRVGRVLVRKLLLRGYKVKALFRNRAGVGKDLIPDSVEVVEGDVGDMSTCQKAVQGVTKASSAPLHARA
jgi:hypothetical protein